MRGLTGKGGIIIGGQAGGSDGGSCSAGHAGGGPAPARRVARGGRRRHAPQRLAPDMHAAGAGSWRTAPLSPQCGLSRAALRPAHCWILPLLLSPHARLTWLAAARCETAPRRSRPPAGGATAARPPPTAASQLQGPERVQAGVQEGARGCWGGCGASELQHHASGSGGTHSLRQASAAVPAVAAAAVLGQERSEIRASMHPPLQPKKRARARLLPQPPQHCTCSVPMTPGTTPSTPASTQRAQLPAAGDSGNRQR